MPLWGGAFNEPSDQDLRILNDSLPYDKRMYAEDIAGSIAYARAIQGAGVISADEADAIVSGLQTIRSEFESGTFVFKPGDEDIHTAVERRLTELVGPVGGKLHTGRSRNDQVATDFRLVVMNAAARIDARLRELQAALVTQADRHVETVMPGYTHLQPAQPIVAAHWLMSFFWMLGRDRERLIQTRDRAAISPLGSGALAGTPFDIDREALAHALGFTSYSQNSLDGVSDRDYVADLLYALSMLGVHLSRLAEDIIIYSNPSFGFVTLDDRYSTGSSLMPQKRNADPMELTRGKTGRLIGTLTGFLTTLKGLPSSYDKDLQEDKEAAFDSVDTVEQLLPVVTAVINTLKLNREAMRRALDEGMLATNLADYLVAKGLPFREAHHVIGRVVRASADESAALSQLGLDGLRQFSPLFEADVESVFNFESSVARRRAAGGTAPDAVRQQIAVARNLLDAEAADNH